MDKSYKYDAFISYRHTKLDKAVAIKLQKLLESYAPPGSAAPKNFKKWRVFRDESELPTSSNLSDHIREALENSRFLIVICSETTKESRWCLEEISYFKELHDGSNANIITLVTSGTPAEVFPDEICTELVAETNDDGKIEYHTRVTEPLAANIASSTEKKTLSKLKRELLRIAAPMLGCGYDTLYKRSQRRTQRRIISAIALVTAAVFLFGIYSSAMLMKINQQKSQLESRNRELNDANSRLAEKNSEVLASQAEMYLEKGNVYSAVKSATDALHSENGSIIKNPKAEKILAEAMGVYSFGNRTTHRTIKLSGDAEMLKFSADGSRIIASDSNSIIYIIDYRSAEIIKTYDCHELFGLEYQSGQSYSGIADIYAEDMTAYVYCNRQIVAINMADGAVKWHFNKPQDVFWGYSYQIVTNPDSDKIFLSDDRSVAVNKTNGTFEYMSDDFNSIAPDYGSLYMDSSDTIYVTSDSESTLTVFSASGGKISHYKLPEPDRNDNYPQFSGIYTKIIGEGKDSIYISISSRYASNAKFICYNKSDMSVKWETDYETVDTDNFGLQKIFELTHTTPNPLTDGEITNNGVILIDGSKVCAFDRESGKQYFEYECTAEEQSILCCRISDDSTLNVGCGKMLGNCSLRPEYEDVMPGIGHMLEWNKSHTPVVDYPYYIIGDCTSDGYFAFSDKSSEIDLYYDSPVTNYTLLDGYDSPLFDNSMICDNGNGVFASLHINTDYPLHPYAFEEFELPPLKIFDVNSNRFVYNDKLTESPSSIAFTDKDTLAVMYGNGTADLFSLGTHSFKSINISELAKAFDPGTNANFKTNTLQALPVDGGFLCYTDSAVCKVDTSGEAPEVTDLYEGSNLADFHGSDSAIVFTSTKYDDEFHTSGTVKIGYLDPQSFKAGYVCDKGNPLEFALNRIQSVRVSDNGKLIAFIQKEGYIGVFDKDKKSLTKIKTPYSLNLPEAIIFSPDSKYLISACANGEFIKYDLHNFKEAGRFNSGERFLLSEFKFVDDTSFIFTYNPPESDIGGTQLRIADAEEMQIKAMVSNYSYFMAKDKKILFTGDKTYYYNYLSAEQLIKTGKEFFE